MKTQNIEHDLYNKLPSGSVGQQIGEIFEDAFHSPDYLKSAVKECPQKFRMSVALKVTKTAKSSRPHNFYPTNEPTQQSWLL